MAVSAEESWALITDSNKSMALEKVECLVTSDVSDNFTVVGKENVIADVKSISFEKGDWSGVDVLTSDDADCVFVADKYLRISGLSSRTDVAVYSADGKLMFGDHFNSTEAFVNTVTLLPGVYVLTIGCNGHAKSVKFVKK